MKTEDYNGEMNSENYKKQLEKNINSKYTWVRSYGT
jgi:hypothetical protein